MGIKKLLFKIFLAGYLKRAYLRMYRYVNFVKDFMHFRRQSLDRSDLQISWHNRYPCLNDNTVSTGFDRHYVFHTAWAARVVMKSRPSKHVDISSSLYFCSILSACLPIDFYDYRPAALGLDNLSTERGDLLRLPFEDGAIQSLSCMHVLEHIGLGRYGDPLDCNGDLKAMTELKRVLARGGGFADSSYCWTSACNVQCTQDLLLRTDSGLLFRSSAERVRAYPRLRGNWWIDSTRQSRVS